MRYMMVTFAALAFVTEDSDGYFYRRVTRSHGLRSQISDHRRYQT